MREKNNQAKSLPLLLEMIINNTDKENNVPNEKAAKARFSKTDDRSCRNNHKDNRKNTEYSLCYL